jgi:malate dehydrogenase (oxaloacetate-decarboxylating)
MKRIFVAIAAVATFLATSTPALADMALASSKNCMACHAVDKKLVGPSYKDIAAKYAKIVATGRSDFPNQINNVLAFPGIFRGALDAGARRITPVMKLAAANAIAGIVGADAAADYIIPSALDERVAPAVAAAVMAAVKAAAEQ